MQKQCTNSACRRSFSVSSSHGVCPWCGKNYPRLNVERPQRIRRLRISSYIGHKIPVIIAVHRLTSIGLAQSKQLVERLPKHGPIYVDIERPENLAEAEKQLQAGGAVYCFIGRRKRKH